MKFGPKKQATLLYRTVCNSILLVTLCPGKKETKMFFCNISDKTPAILVKFGHRFLHKLLQNDVNVSHLT